MNPLLLMTLIMAAVFGLLIGSFLNVVAIRIPKRESISFPPSHCVHCGHRLGPFDLVPVLSYLALRGKCRYCREPISLQYPIGEAATACLFVLMTRTVGLQAELLPGLLLASVLVVAIITDLKLRIIPDRVVFFGMAVGALMRIWTHPLPVWNYAAAFLAGGALMLAVAIVSRGGMGGGDIKLFAWIGLLLGLKLLVLAIFMSSLLGTLYGLTLLAAGKYKRKMAVPFAPFIALAAIMAYLWGNTWITSYMKLFM